MMSADAARSSGAKGIAIDAGTAARLRQMANADATSNFIVISFFSFSNLPLRGSSALTQTRWQHAAALPVTTVPVSAMPTPMSAVPAPVAAMPVPVPAPVHLFGLEAIHLIPGDNGGMGIPVCGWQSFSFRKRMRRKRRGLRACRQRGGARGNPKGEFQKVAAFHDILLLCACMSGKRYGRV